MDFFNFARTAEQVAYETLTLIFFYPMTLVRVLLRPMQMMEMVAREDELDPAVAFTSTIRPTLFLLISIVLGALAVPLQALEASQLPDILKQSWLHLIMFRLVTFSGFPMIGAIIMDLLTPGEVTRETLRKPFNQLSYLYAPYVLVVSPMAVLLRRDEVWPAVVFLAAQIWILIVQYLYFRQFGQRGRLVSAVLSLAVITGGLVLSLCFILVMSR